MIRKRRIPVTTTGSAGSATGAATLSLGRAGILRAIAIDYNASAPATTDVVIKADSTSGATLFTRADSSTDLAATAVTTDALDEAGAAVVNPGTGYPFSSGLRVEVAQSDALANAVVVDVWVEV